MTGVYILKNKQGKIIYIGKSTDLKNRIKTHLKSSSFAEKIYKADYIETQNEAEALIRESELIKKHKPRYNIMLRDDKQYFYVGFSRDKLPRLRVTHQLTTSPPCPPSPYKGEGGTRIRRISRAPLSFIRRGVGGEVVAGPFTDGKSLKTVLKYLRKVFPYYTQVHRKLPCSYCHIDLCPGPDPDISEYKKNISKIKLILNGKRPRAISALKKEMVLFAKDFEFEKAAKARDQIRALGNIFAHKFEARSTKFETNSKLKIQNSKHLGFRISDLGFSSLEAYDISNIQGKEPVASMVRFDNGKPNKSMYRKFKIRLPEKPNDTAMIKEVIRRRLAHLEWPYPDLFLIDGGRGQLNAALAELRVSRAPLSLPRRGVGGEVVALAKKFNELYIPNRKRPIPLDSLPENTKNLLMYARDEAHRFAITYHRKLHRKKSML